jgi:hypothetical protein
LIRRHLIENPDNGGKIMKIDDVSKVQPGVQNPRSEKRGAVGAEDFTALLKDEMSNTGGTEQADSVSDLDALSGVPGLSPAISDPALADRISAVENVITKLDSLDKALNDNSVSPKKLDGIIQELGEAAARLHKSVEGLSSPLSDMSEEANVLAYMESVKLRRGDYA